jgi:hypothetical protein
LTTRWLIETRLGDDPHTAPLRRRWIVAASEADALNLAAAEAAGETGLLLDQLLIDGQEEVFARAEFETSPEHHPVDEVGGLRASAAAQPEGGGDS